MPSHTSQETVQLTGGASIPLTGFGTWPLQGAEAHEGDERIEEFRRDSVTVGLHALPAGPA